MKGLLGGASGRGAKKRVAGRNRKKKQREDDKDEDEKEICNRMKR